MSDEYETYLKRCIQDLEYEIRRNKETAEGLLERNLDLGWTLIKAQRTLEEYQKSESNTYGTVN